MDGEAPRKPWECKVTSRRAEWRMPFLLLLLLLCLLRAANALKGPRLVSGELGGTVTIRCHYAPLSINKHQRKYWCRAGPPMWACHTIVSTNHYIRHGYRGRVTLADFPQSNLFVVRLSRLSVDDEGNYRCGIGDNNNMLFFSMNLIVSTGPSSTIPTAPPAAGNFFTASPAAKRWTSGATQTLEVWRAEWDRVVPITKTRDTTASAQRRQTPVTAKQEAPGTDCATEGSVTATAPIPQSPVLKLHGTSSTAEEVWEWGAGSLVTKATGISEGGKEMTATKANKPGEQRERAEIAVDAAKKTTETTWPSAQPWETLPEASMVSKQPALGSSEAATPASGPHRETASMEGGTEGDLRSTAGDQGPQATPNWGPVAGLQRPSGKGSSRKSASPQDESGSRILTPVSTMLAPFLLVALVLLQRTLRRKRSSQEAERTPKVTLIQMTRFLELNLHPDQLPHMEKEMLQSNPPPSPPPQSGLTVLVRRSGP
ncbi:high affinity immunoglobulin alpha and immunoglobulin mu Fc receptor [Cavia porcellus]|uniref:high affinity immunoglobulin alpha and immunoglobulin mu Fc receptor n=1 Tax=Cavia porcellus TaxID=10141 RepID=UPI002FE0A088